MRWPLKESATKATSIAAGAEVIARADFDESRMLATVYLASNAKIDAVLLPAEDLQENVEQSWHSLC